MTKQISDRDWQALSAYLDNQLTPGKAARLEQRLQEQPDLRAALDELSRTRQLLRSQPRLRAPRNFILTPEMVGVERQPRRSLFPVFGFTSALASLLFVIVLLGDLLIGTPRMGGLQAQAPAAPEAAILEAEPKDLTPASTEALAMEAAPQEAPEAFLEKEAPVEDSARSLAPLAPTEAVLGEAGGYPSPVEEPAMMLAPQGTAQEPAPALEETWEATATSSPTPLPTVEPLPEIAAAGEGELARAGETAPAPPSFWNGWRLLEAALGLIALLSGALALYWWRLTR